jgi:hypothetical protein
MKANRVIYWISTVFIFLFEGVMPALTSQTAMAKESIRHLGYPDYFGLTLTVFKVTGALVLIIPRVPGRAKEWAYAGFACSFIFAFVSHVAVDRFNGITFIPLYVFCFLIVSYVCYHKVKNREKIFARHAL